jgi:hypothetical protein
MKAHVKIGSKSAQPKRQPPPGTEIVKTGRVQKGDFFYAADLRMWMPVPRSAIGDFIMEAIVARPQPNAKFSDAANDERKPL